MQSIKAALYGSWSQCVPGSHDTCNALEFLRAKVLKFEQVCRTTSIPCHEADTHHTAIGLERSGRAMSLVMPMRPSA